ncbi:hypothetical protein BH10PSE2_BH10PSE2_30590 [soil metagenome]
MRHDAPETLETLETRVLECISRGARRTRRTRFGVYRTALSLPPPSLVSARAREAIPPVPISG